MSQLAPFVDAAVSIDRTAWPNTFISYYTWGAAIGLGLDLSLRDRTDGKVDARRLHAADVDELRRAGQKAAPGMVAKTYAMEDLQGRLAQLSGDAVFAREFFAKFVQGHEVPDYARAVRARMGLVMRKRAAGKAWLGSVPLQHAAGGLRVGARAVRLAALQGRRRAGRSDRLAGRRGRHVGASRAGRAGEARARGRGAAAVRAAQRRRAGDTPA